MGTFRKLHLTKLLHYLYLRFEAACLLLMFHLDFAIGSLYASLLMFFVTFTKASKISSMSFISPRKAIMPSVENLSFPPGLILSIIGNCKDSLYFLRHAFENDLQNTWELRCSSNITSLWQPFAFFFFLKSECLQLEWLRQTTKPGHY